MGDFNEILFLRRNWDGWIDRSDKCKVSGMLWIIVD